MNGKILDIGSGNGVLAITLAQRHPEVEVVAIDYWGEDWEYSKSACEKNARVAHVANRVHFQIATKCAQPRVQPGVRLFNFYK